jgi:hypothetical protein
VIKESTDLRADARSPTSGPLSVPESVTDDDRHRYGVLLDRAAERGLLTPYEYEQQLGDLAAADTIDEMRRIVSELPAFAKAGPASSVVPLLHQAPQGRRPARRAVNRWVALAVMLVVVVAALVFLAVYAKHVAGTQGRAAPVPSLAVPTPRL